MDGRLSLIGTTLVLMACSAAAQTPVTATQSGGKVPVSSDRAAATAIASKVPNGGFGYTFSVSGGTVVARNNRTMHVDYSGADAAAVIGSAIAHISSSCGHLYFEAGIYNLNSLTRETTRGYANYYGIGIPGNSGTGLVCQWTFEGDSGPVLLDQFGTPVQSGGVIFYVSPTALSTVSDANHVMGIWVRPPDGTVVASNVWFKNIGVRFPTNQRGNETAIDATQAANVDYDNVVADFNIKQTRLTSPVAGTSGLIGITTSLSSHEENYMKNTYAMGFDVGLDIQSEHTVLINSYAADGNYGIDYGFRGGAVYHPSSWISSGCGEVRHCLTLGPNIQPGAMLNISGLDMEDALSGPFAVVYHAKEINVGTGFGQISYSRVVQNVGVSPLQVLFDGNTASGSNFITQSSMGTTVPGCFGVGTSAGCASDPFHVADGAVTATSFYGSGAGLTGTAPGLTVGSSQALTSAQIHPLSFTDLRTHVYTPSEVVWVYVAPVAQTVPESGSVTAVGVTCTSNFVLTTPAAASTTFVLSDNEASLGTITFAPGSASDPTVRISPSHLLSAGHVLKVIAPSAADATASGLSGSLCATY